MEYVAVLTKKKKKRKILVSTSFDFELSYLKSEAVHLQQHFKGKEYDEKDIGHICRESEV